MYFSPKMLLVSATVIVVLLVLPMSLVGIVFKYLSVIACLLAILYFIYDKYFKK